MVQRFVAAVDDLSKGQMASPSVDHPVEQPPASDQENVRASRAGDFDLAFVPARAWRDYGVTTLEPLQLPLLIEIHEQAARVATTPGLAEERLAGLATPDLTGLVLFPEAPPGSPRRRDYRRHRRPRRPHRAQRPRELTSLGTLRTGHRRVPRQPPERVTPSLRTPRQRRDDTPSGQPLSQTRAPVLAHSRGELPRPAVGRPPPARFGPARERARPVAAGTRSRGRVDGRARYARGGQPVAANDALREGASFRH